MLSRLRRVLDPFLLLLLMLPVVATLVPARGVAADALDHLTVVAICLLFFLHGAKLSPAETRQGFSRWGFQLLVLGCTFLIFPLLGLGIVALPSSVLSPVMATGFLFLCILPSTVQSSIAFTSIARGNVALAVSSASISNVLGVVLTPLLAAFLLGSAVEITAESLLGIFGQLVVPFVAGQLLHRRIGPWLKGHSLAVSVVDQGSVLLVVYAAFSVGVTQGLWQVVPPSQLLVVVLVSCVLLAIVLTLFTCLGRVLRMDRPDQIVLMFCGSKKSQVSGLPMAILLFPSEQVGMYVLPLMIFHLIQLLVCAVIARRAASRTPDPQSANRSP
ncbi:bile acid:sodium symporter family protein [Nocardiopsis sp. JB363]|uniref:bile acid:sodium symporter family protein n=1 Tax=Nocardiopsis sp. JB363 TaxID=1434837 RepID=UPI00097A1C52|nr:bile acid:sodium symporter family protein [Nocardiopsis sp. JB363]SIO87378.1 Sodium/bile acid symporter family [Nocardiopsis sp. JB363]